MVPAKCATPGFLKMGVFRKNGSKSLSPCFQGTLERRPGVANFCL